MMSPQEYWSKVGQLSALNDGSVQAQLKSTLNFFRSIEPVIDLRPAPWSKYLMAASLITTDAPERLQDMALRITQGCLQDSSSTQAERDAAVFLLTRLGNSRAADLAATRDLSLPGLLLEPSPLGLELARTALEMSIEIGDVRVPVNSFQRAFWSSAKAHRWLSLSAPTSAGKSHIVKMWLRSKFQQRTSFRALYIVPTRALIEEVSRELENSLGESTTVTTLPWDARMGDSQHELFVLTQERLHILLNRDKQMTFDLIFVDEAQKLADGLRGVLLQRTLDEAVSRGVPQVIFASPLTSNPEVLVAGVDEATDSLLGETVTVNQTLLHVNQQPLHPTQWDVDIVIQGNPQRLGEFTLPARPTPESKRLPLVAVALGRQHTGNVVYANRAADAEKYAGQIFDALGPTHESTSLAVQDVIELIQKTVHPQYLLARYLSRGVAFHYGNMPLLIREAVEDLFKTGEVNFLVCTSTLLEGVNLPCQNIFARAPQKGSGKPMQPSDFWNLAGRAGRWGKEFQGNIICVDTSRPGWTEVPTERKRQLISRATDSISSNLPDLVSYIREQNPLSMRSANPLLESLFGILASTRRQGRRIANLPWIPLGDQQADALEVVVDRALTDVELSPALLQKHAGISPFALQRLHDHFRQRGSREDFALPAPEAEEALAAYKGAIEVSEKILGADFTANPSRHYSLALLFVQWMRGLPLATLINRRLTWMRDHHIEVKLPSDIRGVLHDVEQYARFEGPRYLSCYQDVLNEAYPPGTNTESLDIAMMMELGVSRQTELSMMSLGLSRTTVVALAEYVVADSLSTEQAIEWLRNADLNSLDLPRLVSREVQGVINRINGPRG